MLVCHCNAVSDRSIRRAVRDGAATVNDVAHACGAGARCGGCSDAVSRIIHTEVSPREASAPAPTPAPLAVTT